MADVRSRRAFILISAKIFLSLVPPSAQAPSPPPSSAYLYLAQLTDDDPHTALLYYQHAIEILAVQLKGKERVDNARSDAAELKSNIVRAYIGMVEIWMDPSYDLWYVYYESKRIPDH